MRDLIEIVRRLPWILERREFPTTPWPWQRCHCGALAEYRSVPDGGIWCWPCKYACLETYECSDPATWGRDEFVSTPNPLGAVPPTASAEGGRPGGEAAAPAAPRRDADGGER